MVKPRTGLRRLSLQALLALAAAAIASLVLFSIFELFPGLIQPLRLEGIRYLGMRSRYVSDPELVFVPRRTDFVFRGRTKGDLYAPGLDVDIPWREVEASYNDLGFRTNSAEPPYRVMLIGDSYVEIGNTDQDTLSERLRAASGLSTFNLGRGWYGPYQYVELFRRFAPEVRPTHAVFCFFAGNDIEDLLEYDGWRRGEGYYDFDLGEADFLGRYRSALGDAGRFLGTKAHRLRRRLMPSDRDEGRPAHPRLAEVQLGDETVPIRIRYEDGHATADRLNASEEWRRLRSLLDEFQDLALEQRIRPLVLYIPTKLQVYEPFLLDATGAAKDPVAPNEALSGIEAELDLELIDLLPVFRSAAAAGELLYHPYDTHWNGTGRQRAAEHMAARLREPGS